MLSRTLLGSLITISVLLGAGDLRACAETIPVAIGDSVAGALSHARPGDTILVAAGEHVGDLAIVVPHVTLQGEPGAVIRGSGNGTTITVEAADVTLNGLTVTGSGLTLIDKNSGIFLGRDADRAVIEDNRILDNLISVYLDGPHDVTVRHNVIDGLKRLRVAERGPAVSLWNTPGSKILDNDIRNGRDGVFSVTSKHNTVSGNTFRNLRFAVHFMYTNDSEVADNISIGNDAGYVMMYSDRLKLAHNVSDHDRDHGLLFNYANEAMIERNAVRRSDKCLFIYNANKNSFIDNWFEGCEIGVHFTAGSERNVLSGNAFVANRTQVMYVGTKIIDWSVKGRGNYYSDNPAFDLNGDGIADKPYRPNNLMDQVIWRAPSAKLLLNSPAVQVVRWAQTQFPALHPGGVIDTAPLMAPDPSSLPHWSAP
ncbi:MAG: nitrous oxide reductase family maturation protein NosD [Ancalomicrobiaceae bacterium]|nr:nitrous oxide reductase family maturation protein NosD [Ancalomicrobiaceae bacterium]